MCIAILIRVHCSVQTLFQCRLLKLLDYQILILLRLPKSDSAFSFFLMTQVKTDEIVNIFLTLLLFNLLREMKFIEFTST